MTRKELKDFIQGSAEKPIRIHRDDGASYKVSHPDFAIATSESLILASGPGHELNAEFIVNRFEHPFLGNLDNVGGYADLKYSFATRWWGAARIDAISFSELDNAGGEKWDYPLTRFEFGLGRRLAEHALMKAVTQIVRYSSGAPKDLEGETYVLQLTVEL